jgi:hypothetical protein
VNTTIAFTPAELVAGILWICGTITAVSAAVAVIVKIISKAKAPEKKQDERITALEKKAEKFEALFDNDNKRLKALEEGNRLTMESLLALMRHARTGNNIKQMEEVEESLNAYIIHGHTHSQL